MSSSAASDQDSPVAGRAARGLLSLSSARAVALVTQLVVFAVLAKHLGPTGIGVFTFGVAFANLFGTLANFGFKQVVIRQVSQEPPSERWLVPNYLYVRTVLAVLAFGVLLMALHVTGYDPEQRQAALIAGSLLFVGAFNAFAASVESRLRTEWIAIADLVEAVLLLSGVAVLAWRGAGVMAFLWLLVAVNAVNQLLIGAVARRLTDYSWRPRPAQWWPVARMALPLGLASILTSIYYQIDITILARLRPDADVGQYGAAYRVLHASIVIPGLLMTVLAPIFARSVVAGRDVLQRRFGVVMHLLTLLAGMLGVTGALTAWRLLPLIPGFAEFGRGGVTLSILAPAAALIFLASIVQGVLIAGHLQGRLLLISAVGAGLNFGLNLLMIPVFGLYGAAATTAATEALVLALSLRQAHQRLGVRWPVERLPATARALAVLVVALVLGYPLHPFLQVGIGVLAYVAALLPTGAYRWSDLGGLVGGSGPAVELAVGPLDASGPALEAAPRSVRAMRRRLRGAGRCRFHTSKDVPLRLLLAARAAGCAEVVTVHHGPLPRGIPAALRRLVADRAEASLAPRSSQR